jgi:hypothetical protein
MLRLPFKPLAPPLGIASHSLRTTGLRENSELKTENSQWQRWHRNELYHLYKNHDLKIIKVCQLRWPAHLARMDDGDGTRSQGRPQHTWLDNT